MENHRTELRTQILGEDAKLTDSGLIDSQRGCVMTSAATLQLAVRKVEEDIKRKKSLEEERL